MKPTLGMGATLLLGSDQYPATVIEVTWRGKRIKLQHDSTKLSGDGFKTFTPNPKGEIVRASLRPDGSWKVTGRQSIVVLGDRSHYLAREF